MEIDNIYNEDCNATMERLTDIDVVLTSPPYNTDRPSGKLDDHSARYESFDDWLTDEQYTDWTIEKFKSFDKILKPNGTVLYNISYSVRKPSRVRHPEANQLHRGRVHHLEKAVGTTEQYQL